MGGIKELLKRHKPEALKTPTKPNNADNPLLIEPVTGKEKERLENSCAEYLQDPNRVESSDFMQFTANMIHLIGGTRQNKGSDVVFKVSHALEDKDTNTSIIFVIKDGGDISIAEIKANSGVEKSEELSLVHSSSNIHLPYTWHTTFHQKPLEFDSYITGMKETASLHNKNVDLKPEDVKSFANRVFKVYEKLEQQNPQLQTPQP